MATLGFGAVATTPIGWVIGAAVASGGAYYGVTRLFRNYGDSRVETIPTFINTPIDLLGAALFDLLGAFAIKVAAIDGHIHDTELATIQNHFITEWGIDPTYANKAIQVIIENSDNSRIDEMVAAFAGFAKANQDCNFHAISTELITLLRDVEKADGRLDEREDLVIEKVERLLLQETSFTSSVKETASVAGGLLSIPKRLGRMFSKNK